MPYQPPRRQDASQFPVPQGADLEQANRLIVELFDRNYPCVEYFPIDIVDLKRDDTSYISGADGKTHFDTLWEEEVPEPVDPAKWVQPHSPEENTTNKATNEDVRVYKPSLRINMQIIKESSSTDNLNFGQSNNRSYAITIPTCTLDSLGLRVHDHDKFIFGDYTYEIISHARAGQWYNTSNYLYVTARCILYRKGS